MRGHVARMEKGRSVFKTLIPKPAGRSRGKWKDNIRINLK